MSGRILTAANMSAVCWGMIAVSNATIGLASATAGKPMLAALHMFVVIASAIFVTEVLSQ